MNYKPILAGAVSGLIAAAKTDFNAFQSNPNVLAQFNWKVASVRWAWGAVLGGLAGLGFNVSGV
jgi:hypothetical protein